MSAFTGVRLSATSAVVILSLFAAAGPASAAKAPAHTMISAHLTATTVLVNSATTVSGTVTPAGGTAVLERLVGTKWQTVAHVKPTKVGAYVFPVRAPKAATTWSLRVVRAASNAAKAGTSATLKLHIVTKQYVVAAASAGTVTSPAASVITGVVIPAGGGTVQVQLLQGTTWIAGATGRIGSGGTFSVSTPLPVGTQHLRVLRPYTSSVAQGTSTTMTVTVAPPTVLAPPTITTAALAAARVGVPYAAIFTATGGSGFYQWSGTGLPAGLTLSETGLLAGVPTGQGTSSFSATVTDSAGHSGTASLSLSTAPLAGRLFAVGENPGGGQSTSPSATTATFAPVLGMDSVIAAAAGSAANLALKSDGTVWAWGTNALGELGNGTVTPSAAPLQIAGLSGVTAVASGELDGYALKSDGSVWAWGDNQYGEVGDGTLTTRLSPVQVSGLTSVVALSATQTTAYALKSDGTVWAWGSNPVGEIGDGTLMNRSTPVQVSGLTGIKAIASGTHNGYALRADGTVAAWGSDQADELGDGAPATQSTVPVTVAGVTQAIQLAGGLNSGYALTASGTVVGWGYNGGYELGGVGSTPSQAIAIPTGPGVLGVASGFEAAYALLPNHTVVGWGRNDAGQLGNGGTSTATTPTPMQGVTGVAAVISGGFSETALLITN